MRKTLMFLPFLALMLSGCANNQPQMSNNQGPTISTPAAISEDIHRTLDSKEESLKREIATSQNAIQTNMQSLLGVGIGKLSDQLLRAEVNLKDLMHAEITSKIGDIQNQMSASVASNNELRAMLKLQMEINANLQVDLKNMAQANAEVKAKLDAVAGINNRLESTVNDFKQSLQAGRDVNNTTTQFTKEMVDSLKSANDVTVYSIKQFAGIALGLILAASVGLFFVLRGSRERADARAQRTNVEAASERHMLYRALGAVSPDAAKGLVPPNPGQNTST